MCGNATMQLGYFGLRQPKFIGCFRGNAIPNVLDKLDALGHAQFQVFGRGDERRHGCNVIKGQCSHSITQYKRYILNIRVANNGRAQVHDVAIYVRSEYRQQRHGLMRDYCGMVNLPIGIENDSHKKIKILAVEVSDYTQLSRPVFRGDSASLDLVT